MTATLETDRAVERDGRWFGRTQLALTALVLVVVFVTAWSTGAYRLAHADDWAYLRMQETLNRTGQIVGVGWNDVSLVGQLEVARALDFLMDDTVLSSRLVVIASGAACAALVWWLIGRTRRRDLRPLALLSFVVFPGVTTNLVTSMTDLPALALMLGCLATGLAAPAGSGRDRTMRTGPLVAAVAFGVAAVTVRQLAGMAPLAVIGMLALAPQRPSSRRKVLAVGAVGFGIVVVFLKWRAGLDRSAPNAPLELVQSTTQIVRTFSILGLGLLPMVLATGGLARWWSLRRDPSFSVRARSLITGVPIAWTLFATIAGQEHSFVRNSVIGFVTFDGARDGQIELLWWLIAFASAVAGGAFVAVVVAALASALQGTTWRAAFARWLDSPEFSLPLMFSLTTFAVACASSYLQQSVWERYMFPVFVGALVLLCWAPPTAGASLGRASTGEASRERRRRANLAATVAASVLALVALLATTDGYTLQEARWKGAEVAVAEGIDVHTVDAGFEFVGAHYEGSADPHALDVDVSYLQAFPGFRQCALANATVDPPSGSREIGEIEYYGGLGLFRRELRVFATPC